MAAVDQFTIGDKVSAWGYSGGGVIRRFIPQGGSMGVEIEFYNGDKRSIDVRYLKHSTKITTAIDPPDMPREFHASLAEHQVMLSFTNDSDAERFNSWWNVAGLSMFQKWSGNERNPDALD